MRTWIRIAVVVLVVLSGVAAPALAQPEVGTDDVGGNSTDADGGGSAVNETGEDDTGGIDTPGAGNNTTGAAGNTTGGENETESGSGNETGTGSGTGDGEGGGGDDGGGGGILSGAASAVGGAVPSAGDWLEDAIEWVWEDIQDGLAGYVDALDAVFVGVAAPGEPTEPSSWVMPGGMWEVPAQFYVAAASMSSVLWAAGFIYLFDIESRQKQREVLRTLLYAIFGTLFGMVLLGLYFNGMHVVATAISPDGADFIQDGGGIVQLGLGHLVVLVLMSINAGVVMVGGLIMYAIYLLPLVLFAFWPFIVASKAVPVKPLQSTANLGLTALGMLPPLRITQSLLLRLADMMVWEVSGIAAQIASLLGTAIILVVALLGLPWIFYQNIETASGLALSSITVKQANRGASKTNDAATSAASRAGGRAKQAAAPYANRARSAANQKAANAKRRAGSRMGGAMLTAKFGTPGHKTPAQAANDRSSSGSGSQPSASTSRDSRPKMPEQPSPTSRSPSRQRAINRQRRNATKRRRTTRSDD